MKANVTNISMDCYSQFEIGSDYSPQLILIYISSLFFSLNVVKHVRSLHLGLSFPFVLLAESYFGRTSDCFAFSIICIIYYFNCRSEKRCYYNHFKQTNLIRLIISCFSHFTYSFLHSLPTFSPNF